MSVTLKPMVLSFIGSKNHILSDCIRESRFIGARQIFATMHKFNDKVLDTYAPSKLQNVDFGEFVQVIKEAYPKQEITLFSDEKNHFITVKLDKKNINYCLYCVYDEPESPTSRTHYYLVAIERDHKLTDVIRPNIDREMVITAWKDYINVIEESENMAEAFKL